MFSKAAGEEGLHCSLGSQVLRVPLSSRPRWPLRSISSAAKTLWVPLPLHTCGHEKETMQLNWVEVTWQRWFVENSEWSSKEMDLTSLLSGLHDYNNAAISFIYQKLAIITNKTWMFGFKKKEENICPQSTCTVYFKYICIKKSFP